MTGEQSKGKFELNEWMNELILFLFLISVREEMDAVGINKYGSWI
jgi:hypothetical protein